MEPIMTISVVVIAFCMVMIMIIAVAVMLRIRRLVVEMEKFVEMTRMHMPPLIHDVTQISSDVRSIVRHVERDIPKLGNAFDSIRNAAGEIHDLERRVREKIETPLMNVSSLISGILRGFYAFSRTLLK